MATDTQGLLNDAYDATLKALRTTGASGGGSVGSAHFVQPVAAQGALTASATGIAGAAVTATLPAAANQTTYIAGFVVTATNPAAIATGVVTVTGVVSGTLSFQFVQSTTAGAQLVVAFAAPLPASAVNTAIAVNLPAITGGGAGAVAAWGFRV